MRVPGTLSDGAHAVVKMMYDAEREDRLDDAEVVCDGLLCWCGEKRTSRAVVSQLLRACLVRDVGEQGKGVERYVLNEDGRKAALDRSYRVPELIGRSRWPG